MNKLKLGMTLILTFILTLSLCSGVFAQTSLEWQKVALEDKIANKIKAPLNGLLEQGQFMVEVEVKVSDPGPPNFDDLQKVGLKVSDIKFDDSKGDYIAFSKVGLEVPVIEKYFQENQMKLKELHRFNESYDVFKNIESVVVNVWLSDQISDDIVSVIKNIVNNIKLPTGEAKAKITFSDLKMQKAKAAAGSSRSMTLKDWIKWLGEFGNAIGLIVATILLGVFSFMLLKKWADIQRELAELEKNDAEAVAEEEKALEEELEEESEDELTLGEDFLESSAEENFARFKVFFDNSKSETVLMVKRWISEETESTGLALKAVAQQLSDEDLIEIFKGLNDIEREKWKNSLDEFLEAEHVKVANKFISEEVMREMIGPSKIQDIDLVDLLLTIRPEVACKFVKEKPEESKILMNLLTPQYSGKILDLLSEQEALEVITRSLDFDFSQVTDEFSAFKTELGLYRDRMERKPFNAKILQMLPDFNPLKEKMLYGFLAKEDMKEEMVKVAREYYPSDLVINLPKEFLKGAMQNYSISKKVQLLASLEAELKNTLMSSFAEEGSASREMLDLEFENLESDQLAMQRIKNKKDDIWTEFIHYIRESVRADDDYASEIEIIITSWVDSLISNSDEQSQAA
jgi:large-conductance mechanosensitive channel